MTRQQEIEQHFLSTRNSDPCEFQYFEGDPYDADGDSLTDDEAKMLSEWEELSEMLLPRRWHEPDYDAATNVERQEELNRIYHTLK